jgi:hypothetical protein
VKTLAGIVHGLAIVALDAAQLLETPGLVTSEL